MGLDIKPLINKKPGFGLYNSAAVITRSALLANLLSPLVVALLQGIRF
jgi:hypothetical protein